MIGKYIKFNAYQILSPAFEQHDDRQHFTLSSTIITLCIIQLLAEELNWMPLIITA